MYYAGEEKLVSLDMLELYWGEDIVYQNPEDVDPDGWLDEGELMELLDTYRGGGCRGQRTTRGPVEA